MGARRPALPSGQSPDLSRPRLLLLTEPAATGPKHDARPITPSSASDDVWRVPAIPTVAAAMAERIRNGRNGRVSPEALWQHAAKLEPKAPWRAIVRELGVSEGNAQRAERDGIVPANVSTRATERFLAL